MSNLDLLYVLMRLLFTLSVLTSLVMVVSQQIRFSHWTFRMFDFPAKQMLIIHTVVTIAYFGSSLLVDERLRLWVVIVAMIPLVALFLLVLPYTRLNSYEVPGAEKGQQPDVSIYMANVYMHNRNYDELIRQIENEDPDCFLLTETDLAWAEALKGLSSLYPYRLQYPQSNTYGMVFFSKLNFKKARVKFILKQEIPSMELQLEVKPNVFVWVYGVHPEPPSPTESETSDPRDIELLKLAKSVKILNEPVICMGDFNDVAWSHTTRLFRRYSGLLDPRIGRGTFNTFHAKYPLCRWPLDHCFVSSHFQLTDMRVLPDIGSDHFPVMVKLRLSDLNQRATETSLTDQLEVEEKLALEEDY